MTTTSNNNNIESKNGVNNMLPAWCKNGQHVLFDGKLHVIECAPKKEYEHLHEVIIEDCETHHCHFENWDNLTPCTPDGRELLPEPPKDTKDAEFSDTLADDLKAGDRVLSSYYGAQATVLGREWDKQRKAWYYRVKFDTMQRHMNGSEFNVTEFLRDGLTKNYDPATGCERVGNAEYYRETLLAEFWGNDRTPRTVYGMEIFKPTDRPSWLVVGDIFSEPKEMTLREVCDMLAARYQEEQGKAA